MRTVTLLQLRTDARLYCDNRTTTPASAHINDVELSRLINLQLAELHEKLVSARGADYQGTIVDADLVTLAAPALTELPEDFFQMLSVSIAWGEQDIEQIESLSTNADYPMTQRIRWERYCAKFFRVRGSDFQLLPAPPAGITVHIKYAPVFVDLVDDGDTYDGVNGWEKLVTLGAAVEMCAIEKTDSGALMQLYAAQRQRLDALVEERQAQDPLKVRDIDPVYGLRGYGTRGRLWW